MLTEKEWAKQIFQVVCVVNDLDKTLDNWKRLVEFNEASIKLGAVDERATCIYNGAPIRCPVRYARFDLGGVDIKLVEPLNKQGGDPYSDCLLAKGQGFHHIGIYTEARDDLIGNYSAMGLSPSYEEITDEGRYTLYDFDEKIGMSVAPWDHMVGPCGERDAQGATR